MYLATEHMQQSRCAAMRKCTELFETVAYVAYSRVIFKSHGRHITSRRWNVLHKDVFARHQKLRTLRYRVHRQ